MLQVAGVVFNQLFMLQVHPGLSSFFGDKHGSSLMHVNAHKHLRSACLGHVQLHLK